MTNVTLVGNTTSEPSLNFTGKGDAAATFTVAVNERIKENDQWVDGEPTFYRVTAWRKLGEQVAEHIGKGDRVIITGKLRAKNYTTKEGETRLSLEVNADEVGKSIRFEKLNQSPSAKSVADPWASSDALESAPF